MRRQRVASLVVFLCAWLLATPAAAAEPSSAPETRPYVSVVPSQQGSLEANAGDRSKKSRPELDLPTLEKRLRDTDAIGVFTKLTLKNQVDDLLERFRAFYEGRLRVPLADLRQPYDLLLMKTITVVQEGDPALATEIASSREAIWEILADPDKFAALASGT